MIPILLILGLCLAGYKVGEKLRASEKQPVTAGLRIGQAQPVPGLRSGNSGQSTNYIRELSYRIQYGQTITRWLVNEATREAFETGQWNVVRMLQQKFPRGKVAQPEQAATPATPEDGQAVAPGGLPDGVSPGTQSFPSPFENVEEGDWSDFVAALRTKEPGWSNDRYIGQFEQNRGRLRALGIEMPGSPEDEYLALRTDIEAHDAENSDLVAEYSGEVIEIGGVPTPVTKSGVLGLLKAAGREGAQGWLTSESDRVKFPRTTETFVRTNGCF